MDLQLEEFQWNDQVPCRKPKKRLMLPAIPTLAREIGNLMKLDDAALRQRWATIFDADSSRHFGQLLMIGRLLPASRKSLGLFEEVHRAVA